MLVMPSDTDECLSRCGHQQVVLVEASKCGLAVDIALAARRYLPLEGSTLVALDLSHRCRRHNLVIDSSEVCGPVSAPAVAYDAETLAVNIFPCL